MQRRDFLGLGLAPLALALPARAAQEPAKGRISLAAQHGMFPNVPLITHEGNKVMFYDDLIRGDKIVLINFFLVRCTDGSCPISTSTLQKAQALLGDRVGRDIFFYTISLQPEADTPASLKGYADNFGIKSGSGWLFLTGAPKDIDHLRRSLGYVDVDPERDKDLTNHISVARYGDDALERWAAVSTLSSPENIASALKFLKV